MTDVAHSAPAPPGPHGPAAQAAPRGAPPPPRPNDPTTFASGFQELPTLAVRDLHPAADSGYSAPRRALRRPWVVQLIAFVILLAVWQYFTVTSDRVPSIEKVVSFMWTEITGGSHGGMLVGEFWGPLGLSLQRYAIGLAIGIPAGVVLGLALGASSWIRGLLNDTTLVLLALPAVVWAFLASLWFGLTSTAPIVAVVLTAIPFVAINFSSGVRSIDPALMEMSKAYKVSQRNRVVDLLLGGTLPSAVTGLRLAFMTELEQPAHRRVVRHHLRCGVARQVLVRRIALPGLRGLDPAVRSCSSRCSTGWSCGGSSASRARSGSSSRR